MSGPTLEHHIRVILTLKALADASTYTLNLCNIPFSGSAPTTIYYPIVKTVNGFGAQMGDFLPQPISTTISLNDGPASIGFERRVSDLFERYTIINQAVQIQIASNAVGEVASGDFATEWYGTVTKWHRSGNDLVLECAGRGLRDRVITKMVNSVDFPSAPAASLGYALPIVFGSSVEVRPIRIDADADASPAYAYATTFGTTYPVGGVLNYFAKARDGQYYQIASAASTTTELFGNAYVAGKNFASYSTPPPTSGEAKLITTSSTGCIVLNGTQRVYKSTTAVPTGSFTFQILEADLTQSSAPTSAPGTVLGSTTYDLSILGGVAVADYDLDFSFPAPIVLKPNTNYYYLWKYEPGSSQTIYYYYDGAVNETAYSKTTVNNFWQGYTASGGGSKTYFRLYGAVLTDTKSSAANSEGFGYASVEVTQRASPDPKPDLTKLDFVFAIQGLKDSSSGTISGTNNLLLESPQYAVELLTKEWSGSAWATGQYDETKHSATFTQVNTAGSTYFRKLNGCTSGRTTLSDALAQICQASQCRITYNNHATTPLGLWVWGSEEAIDATINDEDLSVINYESLGSETIINDVEIYYSNLVRTRDFVTGSALGEFRNFSANLRYYYGYNTPSSALTAQSYALYGTRKNATVTYPWLGDSSSAGVIGESLLRIYAFPFQFVDFDVPYYKYKALQLMDVVRLVTVQLPAFFGTASKPNLPTYTSTGVDTLCGGGHYYRRARDYRAIIESRQIFFDNEQVPKLRLGMRLLNNYGADPT